MCNCCDCENTMVQISRRDAYFYDETGKFLPEKFLRCVEVEASKIPYNKDVPRKGQLPPYYDETKFKKAQLIFENHKVSILFAKLAGLILLLFYITAVRIIILTKKSNTPATAYVRYRDTLQHVVTWYTSDFKDGSRLWKSINTVKAMHHTASSKAAKVPNMSPISQRELAGTVYGFIGFVITKPQYFGLQDLTDDDLEAIVHFWRVICYLLGVDDRYNLCRESLAETKEIFHEASEAYFKRFLLLRLPSYECMQFAAVEGINRMYFFLKPKPFLNFLYDIVLSDRVKFSYLYYELSIYERFCFILLRWTLILTKYYWFRNIINALATYRLNRINKNHSNFVLN